MKKTMTALCLAALGSAPIAAQLAQDKSMLPAYEPGPAALNGYTAEDLIGLELRGLAGKPIGDIKDLVIGPDGQLRRLLVDVNEGLFGTGGQRLAARWSDVTPGPREHGDVQYFISPVTKQNVQKFGVFTNRPAAVEGQGREWRAAELLGDYVGLKDNSDYGSVVDLVFDRQGRLLSIALAPEITGRSPGRTFFSPFTGADPGWDPGDDFVVLPYTTTDVQQIIPD